MSTLAKGAPRMRKEYRDKMLRDLAVSGNATGRWTHLDDRIARINRQLWKLHGELSK